MSVTDAIAAAERMLPGTTAAEGCEDPRWQAIIGLADFIESDPDAVWAFVEKWGCHDDEDLRGAISTCLLEHFLEYRFEDYIARVEALARSNRNFANTVSSAWEFGRSEIPTNQKRLDALKKETRGRR